MRNLLTVAALAVALMLPAVASEPGEPLALEDWELVDPTFAFGLIVPPGECWEDPALRCNANTTFGIDAEGLHWALRKTPWSDQWGNPMLCGGSFQLHLLELVRCNEDLVNCASVARLYERCQFRPEGGLYCVDGADPTAVWLNSTNGRLFFRFQSTEPKPNCNSYPHTSTVLRVSGLPTFFEILQTYTPSTTSVSFRVPYMPEGFQAADSFDTYYGSLATVGDWSQAEPMQCDYPAVMPDAGDYLTVPDTLPTPAPGQGYYYVTAVTYQGQTRYGRKASAGVLSGRDPAVLPECSN